MSKYKLNIEKFQQTLIKEYELEAKIFNRSYSGKELFGKTLMDAKVLEGRLEIYKIIIEAINDSVEKTND